ncbi:TetR/AcrR family transcriptional regulator [Paraburkholderia fungorum]|uniref:AcrR family transcriptional regulator n=1 Tax=Paraburkholderia fungorum TaxID=134537 RepID=A0AAW3UUF5_9BURK|nr:TetR/AcrR family transcriptional regulator [Paraburkholderia fungorum]MBB4514163.1 AcrR family transcriptional regulator [Paraburkholderia fungorum]MBB6202295.1 AcrR family transcriptional regulator [Paraburkholderia fungorum]
MLFARDGFEATSTTRIADAAGVSVGSLYEYFTSKDALIAKLIKRHCEHLMNLYGQAFLAVEGQGIDAVVDTWVDTTAGGKIMLALYLCAPVPGSSVCTVPRSCRFELIRPASEIL